MTNILIRSLSHRPPKVVFSALFIIIFIGTFSVFNLAQSNPQPAVLSTTGSSNRVVIFPDVGSNPSDQLLGSASFLLQPHGVAILDSNRILVSDFNNSRINILQLSTGARLDGITTTGGYNGTGTIAVSPDRRVMFASGNTTTLYVFRAPFRIGTQASTITLPGPISAAQTQGIVFDNAGRAFVNTNFGVTVIDPPYTSISFTMPHSGQVSSSGSIAISPDGNTLLVTRLRNAVKIYSAPFTAESVPVVRIFPAGQSIGLGGIKIAPDGSTAITVSVGSYRAFFMDAPFTASSVIEDIPLPAEGNSGSFEDVGISADGSVAILTGNGTATPDLPAVLVRAPFTAAETVTSNLPVLGVANPSRGAGAVRFLPPGTAPGLTVSASAATSVESGSQLTYTFSYRNTGTSGVDNAEITAPLPAGTSFLSATNGGVNQNGTVNFQLGTIPAGSEEQAVSFSVTVLAPPGQSISQNYYSISADNVLPVVGPPIATFVLGGLGCSPGMVSWWKGENAGNDLVGTNDGTAGGTLGYTAGVVGNAFDFTGGNRINVPDGPGLNPSDAFTLELWASPKQSGAAAGNTTFVAKGRFDIDALNQYAIRFNDLNQVIGRVGGGTSVTEVISPISIPIDVYSHIALTKSGTDLRLYINGALVATAVTKSTEIPATTSDFSMGGAQGAQSAAVRIDEVSLYERALSAQEVLAIFNAGEAGKCTLSQTEPLAISPQTANVPAGGEQQFSATGGTAPYSFSIFQNQSGASIDPVTGLYTAGAVAGTDTIRVTDADNATADATVTVVQPEPLAISPQIATLQAGSAQQFTANGGTAPYSFTIFQNQSGGNINAETGLYTAGPNPGTDIVRVTDSVGGTSDATVTVTAVEPLAISPQIANVPVGGTQQFSASGGTAPYTFSILQNQSGGSINAETGLYTAGPNPGTDIVRVTDSALGTSDATVTVTAVEPLAISPQTANVPVGGTQQFSASGGTAPYTFSVFQNQSGGSIDPGTGLYTAGQNAGTDIVRVTDSVGGTSDATVTVTAGNCSPAPSGLVSWWRAENDALDAVGANNGTLEGDVSFVPGIVGQAFSLNGTNASVLLPTMNLGDSYTIELWANLQTEVFSSFTHLVSNGWNQPDFGALYLLSDRSLDYWQGFSSRATTAPGILPVGQFAHIAVTGNEADGLTRIYVNGVLAATTGVGTTSFNNPLRLGFAINPESNRFPGQIDEATVYDRALSQAEIQAIHAAGEGGKCAPLAMSPQTVTLATGAFQQFEANGGTAPYTFSIIQNETGASINPDTGFYLAGQTPGTDIVRVTDSNNSSLDSTITVLQCLTLPNGIAGWWKGEGNAADAMGGPGGTLEGGATFAPGHIGQAFDLNGSDSSVLLPTMDLGNAFTIELWVNLRNIPQFTQFIALVSNNPSDSGYGSLFLMNDGHLLYQGGSVSAATAPGILPVGQFTHIALTRDANDGLTRIYVNGALAATSAATSFVPFNNPVRLGYSIVGAHARFNGLIDEATFYSRTLSQSELEAIHAAGQGGKCLTPTSAPASVSGRVLTSDGRGLARTRVTLTDVKGATRVAQTNAFGYFAFDSVRVGETYVLAVSHRSYQFEEPERVITVDDDITGIVFNALDGRKPGGP